MEGLFEEKRRYKIIWKIGNKWNMMPEDVESSSGNFRYRFKMRSVIFSYLQAGIEMGCYNHNLRTDFRRKPAIFHQTIWGGVFSLC